MVQLSMNFEESIDAYIPTTEAISLVRRAIKKGLLENTDFKEIVSHTTRLPRKNNGTQEQNGIEYHFIDLSSAEAMIDAREFIEVKYVHGDTLYGTSVAELQQAHDLNKISVTDIDIQGVDEYKTLSRHVVAIFILPPNYDTWRDRLSRRYESSDAFIKEWPKRRESALRELAYALSVPYYHFIINNNLEHAIEVAAEISRQPDVFHRKDDEARIAARDLLEQLKSQD